MITGYADLSILLNAKVAIALDATTEIMLSVLEKYILDEVYGSPEGDFYHRSMELVDSFARKKTEIKGNLLTSEIYNNWMSMSFNAGTYTHGSPMSGDFREHLAEVINFGYDDSIFGFHNPRPFWDKFIEWIQLNLSNTFANQCRLVGIPLSNSLGLIASF